MQAEYHEGHKDASLGNLLARFDDLVKEATQIARRLEQLTKDPKGVKNGDLEELKRMRTFCLALSRRASSCQSSRLDTRSEHPFRR